MNDTTSRLIAAGTAALTWILLFVYMMRIDASLRRLEKR